MIIINFLVGLLIFVVPFSVMYGLGLWGLKRSGDYDADTDFVEIMFNGLLALMLMVACVILLIVIYKVGGLVINNLI
jgi:hypothetical protein